MPHQFRRLFILAGLLCGLCSATMAVAQTRSPLLLEGKKHLYLRVLTRPQATIYKNKGGAGPVVQANIPAFRPFFVYARPSPSERQNQQGWYEVGKDDRGSVVGWIKADDVFEWEQTLSLAYSHPQGRSPVLIFDSQEPLKALAESVASERVEKARELYGTIKEGNIPDSFSVVSMEPSNFIDIESQFYLLPILASKEQRIGGREGRLLKIASVVASGPKAREASDMRHNDAYRKKAVASPDAVNKAVLVHMQIDVVWVFDTTLSTQPYIDRSLLAATQASQQIATAGAAVGANVRFGAWGFRCPPAAAPNIEYDTKNYTPTMLPVGSFLKTLGGIKSAAFSSGDWEEDVFTGMRDAISKTRWREGAIRLIVLVGDAPGHGPGHAKNESHFNVEQVRSLATAEKVFVYSIYIKDPRAKRYAAIGEEQFAKLAENPGVGSPLSISVPSSDEAALVREIQNLTSGAVTQLTSTAAGQLPPVLLEEPASPVDQTLRAAIVEWIGSRTKTEAPRDVTGWVSDKDLLQPAIQSLDIKLLISKRQLSALSEAMLQILHSTESSRVQSKSFFDELQSLVGTQSRDPDRLAQSALLARQNIIPEFIKGLPYKSPLMQWSSEVWLNMSPDQQASFVNDLKGRIAYYKHLAESPELWISLSPSDDPDDAVHALDFSQLP